MFDTDIMLLHAKHCGLAEVTIPLALFRDLTVRSAYPYLRFDGFNVKDAGHHKFPGLGYVLLQVSIADALTMQLMGYATIYRDEEPVE
jgi:hypothetical protein